MSLLHPVEVIAHRGFSAIAPENTLAAFEAAVRSGAGRVELDVQLTRDGVPVVIHDDLLDRTTSGKGPLRDYTWEEVRRLDAGSWFHPRFHQETVPSLGQVLELCRGRIAVNIEIKAGGTPGAGAGLEALVIQAIAAGGPAAEGWAVISSFDRGALERARRADPRVPLELLHDPPGEPPELAALASARALGAVGLNVSLEGIRRRPDLPRLAHALGLRVKVFTVDEPGDMSQVIDLGVDGIFTNRPDRLVKLLGAR